MVNNTNRVLSIYYVEVKVKTKYKTFMSTGVNLHANHISFKGLQIEGIQSVESTGIDSCEKAKQMIDDSDNVFERHYPWNSVVEITLKRYNPKK